MGWGERNLWLLEGVHVVSFSLERQQTLSHLPNPFLAFLPCYLRYMDTFLLPYVIQPNSPGKAELRRRILPWLLPLTSQTTPTQGRKGQGRSKSLLLSSHGNWEGPRPALALDLGGVFWLLIPWQPGVAVAWANGIQVSMKMTEWEEPSWKSPINGNPLQYFCLRIPWTEEHGTLQSVGSQRVGHKRSTEHSGMHAHYLKWYSYLKFEILAFKG